MASDAAKMTINSRKRDVGKLTRPNNSWIAEAVARATKTDEQAAVAFVGEDLSLARARDYVSHVGMQMTRGMFAHEKGGLTFAVLNQNDGRFLLQAKSTEDGEVCCAFLDAGQTWNNETSAGRGVLTGPGAQVHHVKAADREVETSRAFFAAALGPAFRLSRVHQVLGEPRPVSLSEASLTQEAKRQRRE